MVLPGRAAYTGRPPPGPQSGLACRRQCVDGRQPQSPEPRTGVRRHIQDHAPYVLAERTITEFGGQVILAADEKPAADQQAAGA